MSQITRRILLLSFFKKVIFPLPLLTVLRASKRREQPWAFGKGAPLTTIDLMKKDKVDRSLFYFEEFSSGKAKQKGFESFLQNVLWKLFLPKEGKIVEFGTWDGGTFEKLCHHFGEERCLGFDAAPYIEKNNILVKDVRTLGESDNFPISFAWNDVSTWYGSTSSKLKVAQFCSENLVKGGYLLDVNLDRIPSNIQFIGYEVVLEYKKLTLFRKISDKAKVTLSG